MNEALFLSKAELVYSDMAAPVKAEALRLFRSGVVNMKNYSPEGWELPALIVSVAMITVAIKINLTQAAQSDAEKLKQV